MKFKPVKSIPALIAFGVIVVVCAIGLFRFDVVERLERITYDMRVRQALKFSPAVATNLAFVSIDDGSIDLVRTNTTLGYRSGLYWPRHIYGRLANELASQGARAVAFDIIFGELRPDHSPVLMSDRSTQESDEFFAFQIQRASNIIIAAAANKLPPPIFLTNALTLGDISIEKDRPEGILRRTKAFRRHRQWHPLFEQAQRDFGFDLDQVRIEPTQIVGRAGGKDINVPLDKEGNFTLADLVGEKLPAGTPHKAKPFTETTIWSMGIVLAAQQLQLDLDHAAIDLKHHRVTLHGAGGLTRVIPVDADGYFYIDWSLPPNHPQLTQEPIYKLLLQNSLRLSLPRQTNETIASSQFADPQRTEAGVAGPERSDVQWRDKLVIVGSSALGNDLTDRGATPLAEDTLLASKHWNVASSIITGRFVRRAPLALELFLIALLGVTAAFLTWHSRVLLASGLVLALAFAYILCGVVLYVQSRYWIPLVLPVTGGLFMNYVCLVAWRVKYEQAEVRRVKSIFSKIVSPKIMKELLHAETLSLIGTRREVSVLFTDVRGFTELTDLAQEQAEEFVRKYNLTGQAAESCFDEQARDILSTVNTYLGVVADIIIKQDGTLDKFIGDCVMAFWGAPTPNPSHAVACVHTAIEAQRTIHVLNQARAAENQRRELENKARLSAGLKPKTLLPLLVLGSGINSGIATAGLMGSQAEQKNYTVFGREVNLASRLEGLSGHARIFISHSTYQHLLRDDPTLAATCVVQPPQKIKGIGGSVKVYEVPWRPADQSATEQKVSEAVTAQIAAGLPAGS